MHGQPHISMCCVRHYSSKMQNTENVKDEGRGKYSRNFIRNKRYTYVKTCVILEKEGTLNVRSLGQ